MTPETLRAWRKARGLSRREAAEMLAVNERTLERLEYGLAPTSALWGPIDKIVEMGHLLSGSFDLMRGPPSSIGPEIDRDDACAEAIDPHLDALAARTEAAGWHPAEVVAAVISWAAHRAADGAGEDAARALLLDAAEVVALRERAPADAGAD
jgi:transcriptional regulator with XRE-family HTH domain